MVRIFVTGDNHIGLKYAGHEQAATLAAARLSAFDGMVDAANREDCALFVITGDLFENTYSVPKRDIKALFDKLTAFRGTVVILPGNHDYYDKDLKLWQWVHELLPQYDNVMLMNEYRPYPLEVNGEDVVLYPALCTSLHSAPGENNLGWIKELELERDGTIRVGVAHGAIEGETIDSEGQYFLMKRDELSAIPVDVWLIGHTHVPFPRDLREELTVCEPIVNIGTHVQTDVACNTEGLCGVVEIADDKTVRAKKVKTGTMRFYRKHITLTAGDMQAILDRELAPLGDDSVVELVLSGAVCATEYDERATVLENALARFTEGTYRDYDLSRQISKELIDAEFPETSFSAGLLNALLEEPKEAQLVYELLRSLKEGK